MGRKIMRVGRFGFAHAQAAAPGEKAVVACSALGRQRAREGVGLGEALDELRSATEQATGHGPAFEEIRALGTAWAEETMSYLHQLSCEDPLTGLASPAHLRARLTEFYRGARVHGIDPATSHAVAVVEAPPTAGDPFSLALWMVRVVEVIRLSFPGEESVAQLAPTRLAFLVAREPSLGVRLAGVRVDLEEFGVAPGVMVWLERLPPGVEGAVRMLDDLLRR